MRFQFTDDNGKILQFDAEDTGVTFNYTDFSSLSRPWTWSTPDAQGNKYYANTVNVGWLTKTSMPTGELKNKIFRFDKENVLEMKQGDSFYDDAGITTFNNGKLLHAGENATIRLSWRTYAIEQSGQPLEYHTVNGGFYAASPTGNAPFYNGCYPEQGYSGTGFIWNDDYVPKMSFWMAKMYDNVSSSPTFGKTFDVLVIAMSETKQGGSSNTEAMTMFDMRILEGATALVPSKSTTRGNSPTGWTGGRSDRSDSDIESHIGAALKAFVNNFEYGTHLYRLSHNQMQDFFTYLWSDNVWDSIDRETNNPIRGVISLHHMPTHVTAKGVQECVKLCGKQAVIYGTGGIFAQQVMADVAAENKVELKTKIFHPEGYSDSFLDWGGNTRIKFRLPFIGTVPVNANAIMDGGIFAKYNIDFITGNCLVQIYTIPQKAVMGTDEDWSETYSGCLVMLAQYAGNCAHKLNVSTCDFGGATAMGSIVSSVVSIGTVAAGALTENPMLMLAGAGATLKSGTNAAMTHENMSVIGATPNADTMGMMVPALIIERPIDLTPLDDQGRGKRYQDFVGRPAASGGKVKDYKVGFEDGQVFIQGILHADTLYATEAEKKEIEAGFAKGMYV